VNKQRLYIENVHEIPLIGVGVKRKVWEVFENLLLFVHLINAFPYFFGG
jgi:hypothetical protein